MQFDIRMGVPELMALWNRLQTGAEARTLDRNDRELAVKLAKALRHLGADPFHPGLQSHEIDDLTRRYKRKVFQSYLENNTPGAGRLFWTYGPEPRQITVVGLEPHPDDGKNAAYKRVKLSDLPPPHAVKPEARPGTRKRRKT
jgi:hypothetical protein